MGTSKSSSGAPSGVPMVPPWTPALDDDSDGLTDSPGVPNPEPKNDDEDQAQPIAPQGRFRATRIALGDYASSGDRDSLRRAVGRYIASGLGGSATAVRRMGGTAITAGALYSALGGDSPGAPEDRSSLDAAALEGKSAEEVLAAVIQTVKPVDGTQEAEASRRSINDALAELMKRHPDADLLSLTEAQREFVIDHFVSMDVFRQFNLDVGKTIQDKAPNATTGVARLKEAREFIRETILASFRKLRTAGKRMSGSRVARIVKFALEDAFAVFSGYAE